MTPEEREIDMAACAFRLAWREQVAKGRAAGACLIALRRVLAEVSPRDTAAIRQREGARASQIEALQGLAQMGGGDDDQGL